MQFLFYLQFGRRRMFCSTLRSASSPTTSAPRPILACRKRNFAPNIQAETLARYIGLFNFIFSKLKNVDFSRATAEDRFWSTEPSLELYRTESDARMKTIRACTQGLRVIWNGSILLWFIPKWPNLRRQRRLHRARRPAPENLDHF